MSIIPQFYYLNQSAHDGFYFTSAFTLAKKNFPLTVSSIINKVIETNISAGKDFVWNVTLTYSSAKDLLLLKTDVKQTSHEKQFEILNHWFDNL